MRDFITNKFPPAIIGEDASVRISLYMPTHRTAPDNRQDVIRFKNLVNQLEERKGFDKQVELLRTLERDQEFWIYNLDSIGVLIDDLNNIAIYRMTRDVKEYLEVGKRFYLKPLIRNYQSDETYHALGLARDQFRLYKGNRYGFSEVEIDDEDRLLKNVLGDTFTGGRLNVVSHGGSVGNFHGHGAKSEEVKVDTEKFFYYVDKYIRDNYSLKEQKPLILIAPTEDQSLFRKISSNEFLVDSGVNRSFSSIDPNNLKEVLWQALEPIYNEKTEKLINQYNIGINKNQAFNTIQETLEALVNNRVKILVLQADKFVTGTVDIEKAEYKVESDGEDILNQLAHIALDMGSEVVILPEEKMPKNVSIFSILRF